MEVLHSIRVAANVGYDNLVIELSGDVPDTQSQVAESFDGEASVMHFHLDRRRTRSASPVPRLISLKLALLRVSVTIAQPLTLKDVYAELD